MNENIIVPPPPSTLSSQTETGAMGVQTQITEKNSDKGVFLFFFCNYTFLRFKRVETFIGGGGGGGGGATFYYLLLLFFFFLGGGGVEGVQILISIETYIACKFRGRGGGPDHLSLSE